MKLVYFGKKRSKVIKTVSPEMFDVAREEDRKKGSGITYIPLPGPQLAYSFEPFKTLEVDDEVGGILMDKANDLFKRVDKEPGKPDPKPVPKTDGYVGDTHAERIPDLKKKVEAENRAERGKSVEEVIQDHQDKKKKRKEG